MLGSKDKLKGYPFIKKLTSETTAELKKIKSRNQYLNQFIERRARKHQDEMLANTYLIYFRNEDLTSADMLIGYYTLSNSSLRATELIKSKFHHNKQYDDYPSVLIGRLAISKEWEGNGYGDFILDSIKMHLAGSDQISASRFLMVHSIKESVGYYQKNDFDFWTKEDKDDDVRLMYLSPFHITISFFFHNITFFVTLFQD